MSAFEPDTAWDDDDAPLADVRYAGFSIRFAAVILDACIFTLPMVGILALFGQFDTDLGSLLYTVAEAAYSIVLWTTWGRTIGGAILGLRLVRTDGRPVTFGTATIRYLMLLVSYVALCIGIIWVAFHPKKQGWMDIAADTYVIRD